MKAAIYCRVDGGGSPEMRRDALEMQKQELERYAVRKRIHVSGYYEDDGFPGYDLKRPGLTQMLKDSSGDSWHTYARPFLIKPTAWR